MAETFFAVQYLERAVAPGEQFAGTEETRLGTFESEDEAIDVARNAWRTHRTSDSHDVAWWIVRRTDDPLARWIADSRSPVERVVDLSTGRLIEVPSAERSG